MASRRRRKTWDFDDSVGGPDGERDGTPREPARSHRTPEVDLHGCTVDAAERRVAAELTRYRASGVNEVLVITGAGHGSLAGRARLAPAIERWLRSEAGRSVGVSSVRMLARGGALEVRITKSKPRDSSDA